MIKYLLIILFVLIAGSCNNSGEKIEVQPQEKKEASSFFPVTDYLRGQIAEIKTNGVTPIKTDSSRGSSKTDSVWLKAGDLDSVFHQFLQPEIDSTNLIQFFEESKFNDQTLDTYTFTYSPAPQLPDSFTLLRWDVYINRSSNAVKRIFMVKKAAEGEEMQLTWQSGKWCKTVTIARNKEGTQFVAHEQTIKWSFE
jgi:hypothetical protein